MNANHGMCWRTLGSRGGLLLAALLVFPGCPRSSDSTRLSQPGSEAAEAKVALAEGGSGHVLWIQTSPQNQVLASEFAPDAGFRAPLTIFAEDKSHSLELARSDHGTCRAAWVATAYYDQTFVAIKSERFFAARPGAFGLWSVDLITDFDLSSVDDHRDLTLAVNDVDDAVLAFRFRNSIFVSVSVAGGAWLEPPLNLGRIFDSESELADIIGGTPMRVAIGPSGDWILVHDAMIEGTMRLVVRHGFDPTIAVPLDDGFGVYYYRRSIAATMDADGAATVLWHSKTSVEDSYRLDARRFDPVAGWSPIEHVADVSKVVEVRAGIDAAGNVQAMWEGDGRSLFSAGRSSGGAWDPFRLALPFDGDASALITQLEFAIAADGDARCCYRNSVDQLGRHWSDRFDPAAGWIGVHAMPEEDLDGYESVDLDVESGGTSVAVWIDDLKSVRQQTWGPPRVEIVPPSNPLSAAPAIFDAGTTAPRTTGASLALYEWDFDGDGVPDVSLPDPDGRTVDHVFGAEGTYHVTLRVVDDGDFDATTSIDVVVGAGGGPPWRLLVLDSGGTGVVTSNLDSDDDGTPDIVTPGDREEFYADGPAIDDHALVYLTPTADAGFTFDHWEGLDPLKYHDSDYGGLGCLVQVSANRTITAVFVPLSP